MRILKKTIPKTKLALYEANDWHVVRMHDDRQTVYVQRAVDDAYGNLSLSSQSCDLKNPYLIQRCTIRRPLNTVRGATYTQSVSFDYMGSAEFEGNVIAESLTRIWAQYFDYDVVKVDDITVNEGSCPYVLRLLTHFEGEDLRQYVEYLKAIKSGQYQLLHDHCDFENLVNRPQRIDLWHDIENDAIFSFDRQYMTRLMNHLDVSFTNRNQKHANQHQAR